MSYIVFMHNTVYGAYAAYGDPWPFPRRRPFAELSDRKHKNAFRILMKVSGHVRNSTVYDAVLHNSRVFQLSSEIDFIMTL